MRGGGKVRGVGEGRREGKVRGGGNGRREGKVSGGGKVRGGASGGEEQVDGSGQGEGWGQVRRLYEAVVLQTWHSD